MTSAAVVFEPSYYEASVQRPPTGAACEGEHTADVCVIGGGFTGLSAAMELAAGGRRVIVLEAKAVGWGASGRNGGQVLDGYSAHNLSAPARMGGVSEKALFAMSLEAVELVKQRIAEHDIACDWRIGYAEAAMKPAHLEEMKIWAEKAAREYDYPDNEVLDAVRFREVVASRRYCGGLLNNFGGHLHPLKYVLGLASVARARGVEIYENSEVINIARDGGGGGSGSPWTVKTAAATVRCGAVLLAGNAYAGGLRPDLNATIMPVGTYIGATPPLGARADALIADNRCVCNSNFVLDYFRVSADKRLLFGGRVSYSTRPPMNLRLSLWRRMVDAFPQLSDLSFEYAWGGYVAITINRFPDIGRTSDGLYYAQGFSGHGVALSGFAGKVIADAIVGDSGKFDVFNRIRHRPFPGGALLRTPLLVLGMLYYRMRDLL